MSKLDLVIPYEFTNSDKKAFAARYTALMKFNNFMVNEFKTTFKDQNLNNVYPLLLKKLREIMEADIAIKYQLPFGVLQKELTHLIFKYMEGSKILLDEKDAVVYYLTYPLKNSCYLRTENDIVVDIEPYKSPFVIYMPDGTAHTKEELQEGFLNISYKPEEDVYRIKIS
jgi:hypothetical protein